MVASTSPAASSIPTKFDIARLRKYELNLQERIDTGLVPSFYSFMNIYASAIEDLRGDTDLRPELLTLLAMGYVRHKRDQLMNELEQKIRKRINDIKKENGSISNSEIGRIRIEESVKMMASIIAHFEEKYERRQTIGLLISPKDMEELDAPPIVLDLNSCEDKLREMGVAIENAKGVIEESSDYEESEEYSEDDEEE